MRTIDFQGPSDITPQIAPQVAPEPPSRGPFDGDLLDLYVAIVIVVPLALLLKSLWV